MSDFEMYGRQLAQAWLNTGRSPAYHRKMQAQLWREWPVLAQIAENAAKSVDKRH